MKPTKMRNHQIYRAKNITHSLQTSSPLSKDLQAKYSKKSIRVVEGDTVKVVRGEYRGIEGKVSRVSADANKIAIEGIKKEKTRGGKFDVFIHASNILIVSLSQDDRWRANKLEGQKGDTPAPPTSQDTVASDGDTDDTTDKNTTDAETLLDESTSSSTDEDNDAQNEDKKYETSGDNTITHQNEDTTEQTNDETLTPTTSNPPNNDSTDFDTDTTTADDDNNTDTTAQKTDQNDSNNNDYKPNKKITKEENEE